MTPTRRPAGEVIEVGALLDDAGSPIGSAMIGEFSDRAAADAYVAQEPYTTSGVWVTVEVTPLRLLTWE